MFAKPRKMPEIILSDTRTGFDLNTCKIAVCILDNEVYFTFVNVAILVERVVARQINLCGKFRKYKCLDNLRVGALRMREP